MEITQQLNQQECGVCVIHSLIKHFHGKHIDYSGILSDANVTNQGLTIYDLELLGQKYGLHLESYNATIEELKNISHKKPFVLLIQTDNNFHYVIAKKAVNNQIAIFCSIKGKYILKLEELAKIWSGIYIECSKTIINFDIKEFKTSLKLLNLKWLLIANSISLIYIAVTLFCGTFIQHITNLVITDMILSNLVSLCLVFLFAYITQYIIRWVLDLWSNHNCFTMYHKLHSEVLSKLHFKYDSFFKKINQNYLINMDDYLYVIASFYVISFNKFIADSFLLIAICFIVALIDYRMLLLCFAYIIFLLLIDCIKLCFHHNNHLASQEEQNHYKNNYLNYLDSLKSTQLFENQQNQLHNIKATHEKLKNRFHKNLNFENSLGFFDSLVNTITMIILIIIGIYLIQLEVIAFSKLFFCLSLLQILNTTTKSLCNIPHTLISVNHARNVIQNILNVDNININEGLVGLDIENIEIDKYKITNDTILIGKSGSGKTTSLKQLALMQKSNKSIKINGVTMNNLQTNWWKKNCIYINQSSNYHKEMLFHLFKKCSNLEVIEVLQKMELNDINSDDLSTGQKQALNFLSLLLYNKKVLLLDECLSNVDPKLKILLLTKIKPILIRNNFVIYVDHTEKLSKHFLHKVVMHA